MERFVRFARQLLLVGLLALLPAAHPALADEVRLVVTIQDVRGALGKVRVSLYREAATFRKEDRAVTVISIPAGDGQAVFDGLAPGRYALMAYHDENGDGKLNLRFGMFPSEGYGLSNNPKIIGPPKFDDSAFDLAGPQTSITVGLSY